MILRRVIAHFKKQEWTAIALDFLIVVVGVFVGLQVNNWNEARISAQEYELAKSRLLSEVMANLAELDQLEPDIKAALATVRSAIETLKSCSDDPAATKIVSDGLNLIRGTYGVHSRRSALAEMTSNQLLVAQQSLEERDRFRELEYYIVLSMNDGANYERAPLDIRLSDIPMVTIGELSEFQSSYFGIDYTAGRRPYELGAPISEACHNKQLLNAFYVWENNQAFIPVLYRHLRREFDKTKSMLETSQ